MRKRNGAFCLELVVDCKHCCLNAIDSRNNSLNRTSIFCPCRVKVPAQFIIPRIIVNQYASAAISVAVVDAKESHLLNIRIVRNDVDVCVDNNRQPVVNESRPI